jgi:C-terminal processing protease CtpA/Prc
MIDSLVKKLSGYVFPKRIEEIRGAVLQAARAYSLNKAAPAQVLVDTLNARFSVTSHDKHLKLSYNPDTTRHGDFIGRLAREHDNGFDKIEIFPGNIGYMRIVGFFPSPGTAESMGSAFDMVASTDALIIDLRNNTGGEMETALLSVSHLLKESVDLFDLHFPGEQKIEQHWSASYVPGKRYLDKPVYVLTSSSTFSGAEAFAYALQAEKRATIVGETTGGGANITELIRLPGGFLLSLPVGSPIEPKTQTNWETVGVKPDINVSSEKALLESYRTALQKVDAQAADSTDRKEIDQILKRLQL